MILVYETNARPIPMAYAVICLPWQAEPYIESRHRGCALAARKARANSAAFRKANSAGAYGYQWIVAQALHGGAWLAILTAES